MKNIIDKIWDEHVVYRENETYPAIFYIDLQMLHEVTSAQAFKYIEKNNLTVRNPKKNVATIDHSIPTRLNRDTIYDKSAEKQINRLRENTKKYGIELNDTNSGHQGIVHVIGPELGLTQPGMTIVCGDSHTSTHGAFGALAFGVGTTEVTHVLATNCILQKKSKTMNINFIGAPKKNVYAKDIILKLISKIGISGANGHIIEYTGNIISKLSMEERMTICNMSIECGAKAGLISPDKTTLDYLKNNPYAESIYNQMKDKWLSFQSDSGCKYDKSIAINIDNLNPMISWGINPEQSIEITSKIPNLSDLPKTHHSNAEKAFKYTGLKPGQKMEGIKIDFAFLGSCTNSRLSDLKLAADIIRGKKINNDVTMLVVPGSEQVKSDAEKLGLDKIFIEAGASWRNPGCSMCLGMNDDIVPPGKRCISTSNRNFIGRQGPKSITHLASPATVAISAINGHISNPQEL